MHIDSALDINGSVAGPRMAILRYKHRWGWEDRRISAPPSYLPYDCQPMKDWRNRFHAAVSDLDMRLVLNYDQIWRLVYRGTQRTLFKLCGEAGSPVDPLRRSKAKRRDAAVIEAGDNIIPTVHHTVVTPKLAAQHTHVCMPICVYMCMKRIIVEVLGPCGVQILSRHTSVWAYACTCVGI